MSERNTKHNNLLEKTSTEVAVVAQRFSDHILSDEARYKRIECDLNNTSKDIGLIKNNHLAHMQKDISNMHASMEKNTTDTEWLKKFFWIVAAASIGSLVSGVLNLVIK